MIKATIKTTNGSLATLEKKLEHHINSHSLTWLHLSDFHLCEPETGWHSKRIVEKLIEDIEKVRSDQNLSVDLLFVTGDLAFGQLGGGEKSLTSQFQETHSVIEKVRELLGLATERVFLVPGNHDIDRSKVLAPQTEALKAMDNDAVNQLIKNGKADWQAYVQRLDAYRDFIKANYPHLNQDETRLIYANTLDIRGLSVGIAGLNSAWSATGKPGDKGKLRLSEWQLSELAKRLENSGTTFNIALSHHPLNWLTEHEDPNLSRQLQSRYSVFLHGHEHNDWVDQQGKHLKVAAGACYGKTPAETGYNFVQIQGCEVKAWLRRFDDSGQGWTPRTVYGKTDDFGCWSITLPTAPFQPMPKPVPDNTVQLDNFAPDSQEAQGLFGRGQDLDKLLNALKAKSIVSLYGVSGIGKTWLVREAARGLDKPTLELSMHRNLSVDELYRQLASALGCRDEDPVLPRNVLKNIDFSGFASYSKRAEPRLLHLCKAHELYQGQGWRDDSIGALLLAITKHYPQIKIVLESAQLPPAGLIPDKLHGSLKLLGLTKEAVRRYFRQPFGLNDTRGWVLDDVQSEAVFHALEDRHKIGKNKEARAHPLGMTLLAVVADGLGESPAQVLESHPDKFYDELRSELFDALYKKVLNPAQQHVLRLCSLYREPIPDHHVDSLNLRVGDELAFDQLKQRLLLSPDANEERYELHQLFAELTKIYLLTGRALREDHSLIAECWLQRIKGVTRRSLPNILAAGDAAHHFLEAGDYRSLEKLAHGLLGQDTAVRLERLSQTLHEAGNDEDNRRVLALLVALQPDNHKAHRFLGEAIERLECRGHDEALLHYRAAHDLSPEFAAYLSNLGCCLLERNEAEEFIGLVDSMPPKLQAKSVNDHVWAVYCQCLQHLGRGELASATRQRLINGGSCNAAFYCDEALYLAAQNQLDAAIAVLDKTEQSRCANDHTRTVHCTLLERAGRGDEASAMRQRLIEGGSCDPVFYAEEALYLAGKGLLEAAFAALDKAEQNRFADDHTRAIKARLLEQDGRGDEASDMRRQLINGGSRCPAFYNDEALYLEKQQRVADAVDLLQRAGKQGCADGCTENILKRLQR